MWLQKVFLILRENQEFVVLSGNVYINEMFYKVVKRKIETKDGKQLRGLSHNQFCIGVGCDHNKIIAVIEELGKTSGIKTEETFLSHIKPNSKLIHDDEKNH